MQHSTRTDTQTWVLRRRQLRLTGAALTLVAMGACNDDAIVYPNRNLKPAAGGATSSAGDAGTAGVESGGMHSGGTGGFNSGGGGSGGLVSLGGGDILDDGGASGTGGETSASQCGDHIVQPPEECDDGNLISGDGCSAQCKSSCETCEKDVCPSYAQDGPSQDPYVGCYQLTGTAVKGAAAGIARSALCAAALDCVRAENCAQLTPGGPDIRACWCDVNWGPTTDGVSAPTKCKADPSSNPTTFVKGKCYQELTDASEATTSSGVLGGLTAVSNAFGAAYFLYMACDRHICTEECTPGYYPKDEITTISAGISAVPNAAGESQLGDLVADSQRLSTGADLALVSDFEFAPDKDGDGGKDSLRVAATPNRPADANGRVLRSEAYAAVQGWGGLIPLGNYVDTGNVATVTLTGQQLLDTLGEQFNGHTRLSVSGLKYTWKAGLGSGPASIILVAKSDGTALDPAKSYTVALSTALTSGQAAFATLQNVGPLTQIASPAGVADVWLKYLSSLPQPVSAPASDRITLQAAN